MRSIEIKAVDNSDFDIWLPLWKAYQRFYHVDIPEPVTLKTWARLSDPVEPMLAAIAVMGEQALGLVHWVYHRSTWTTGDYCYLQDLFVAEDARSSAIGPALIKHAYADARCRGASRVYWLTHESNHIAMRHYDHHAEERNLTDAQREKAHEYPKHRRSHLRRPHLRDVRPHLRPR